MSVIGKFKAIVTDDFIEHRDRMAPKYNAGVFGADAEFPEYHQCKTDPDQEIYKDWHYDTYHTPTSSAWDYKMHSQNGIHVSPAIQRVIKSGKTDCLVIWRWIPEYTQLEAGMEVEYEIMEIVDAKLALEKLNYDNRFIL
jgi:hypothetical protein